MLVSVVVTQVPQRLGQMRLTSAPAQKRDVGMAGVGLFRHISGSITPLHGGRLSSGWVDVVVVEVAVSVSEVAVILVPVAVVVDELHVPQYP